MGSFAPMVTEAAPMAVAPPGKVPVTAPKVKVSVSSPSFTISSVIIISTVCSVAPAEPGAGKVTLPPPASL